MSVLKSKRTEGKLIVYDKCRHLTSELLKTIYSCLNIFRDKNIYDFGFRLLEKEVFHLQDDLHEIANKILQANSIFAKTEEERIERRKYQTAAIGYCNSIQNDIISLFDLNNNLLKPILIIANDFYSLEKVLKAWRKANSKEIAYQNTL